MIQFIKQIIAIALVITLYASCDPGTNTKRIIKNNSHHNIAIIAFGFDTTLTPHRYVQKDSVVVPSNTSDAKVILSHIGRCSANDELAVYLANDSIVVNVLDNVALKFHGDLTNTKNWLGALDTKRHGYTACSKTFTIEDTMVY